MCSYHGWRFQGDGKCMVIPQALDEKANSVACANQRSCATARLTKVSDGTWELLKRPKLRRPMSQVLHVSLTFQVSGNPSPEDVSVSILLKRLCGILGIRKKDICDILVIAHRS
jgi:hypothetical protein